MKRVCILFICLGFLGCNEFMHDAPKGPTATTDNEAKVIPSRNHADGKALFMANCASCHNPLKDATGPALQGALQRWNNDTARLHAYVRNPSKLAQTDEYAKALQQKWNINMTAFPDLTNDQIDAIFQYTSEYSQPSTSAAQ